MKYLLDANWVISFLNGRAQAVALVESLADEGIAMSIIAWGEVYEGLSMGPSFERRLDELNQFTANVDLLLPDQEVARHYARVRAHLRSRGQLIADNDLWIAATALAHDLTLVSRDAHFERIPDLKLHKGN